MNIIHRKKFLFIFIINFVFFNIFGESQFKIVKSPDLTVATNLYVPVQTSLKNEGPAFSNVISLDFSSMELDTAFRLSAKSTDTVLSCFVKPLQIKAMEIGVGAAYHLYDYFTDFFEHDIVSNNYLRFFLGNKIEIKINFGTFYKFTFYKNKELNNPLYIGTGILGMDIFWNINDLIKIYFSVNSIDYFDYSLFGTPFFKLGVDLNCTETTNMGCDFTVKMIDMVAVAENISEMMLRFYLKVSL